jgi:hypothetical protein
MFVLPNVILLSVVMPNVLLQRVFFAEYHFADCLFHEIHSANVDTDTDFSCAECCSFGCHNAESCLINVIKLNVILLSVITLIWFCLL